MKTVAQLLKSNAAGVVSTTQVTRLEWLSAILSVLMQLGIPCAALADDIYKWTDEQGRSVLSNVPPTKNDRARNVKLLVKDTRPVATITPTAASVPVTPSTEQTSAKETTAATAEPRNDAGPGRGERQEGL